MHECWLVDPDAVTIGVRGPLGDRLALAQSTGPADRVQSALLPQLRLVPRDFVPSD